MNFEGEFDPVILENIQNGIPHIGDIIETGLNGLGGDRRETVKHVPDRRTGEAGDDLHSEIGGGFGGQLHLLNGPFAFFLRLAGKFFGTENIRSRIVVRIAHELSCQMIADRVKMQVAAGEFIQNRLAVFFVFGGLDHVEVVAGTGQFHAIIAPGSDFLQKSVQRHIGPLSGKKSDRSFHGNSSLI